MSLQPAIQHDRHTGQTITWYLADGTTKKVLTGATITGTLTTPAGVTTAIGGVLTVTDGPNGVFTWAYGANDTATATIYNVQFTATYAADGLADSSFVTDWTVQTKY